MFLACQATNPNEIRIGDIVTFNYAYSKTNPPPRCGMVEGFVGKVEKGNRCIVLWDYSAPGGARFKSYRLDGLRDLARVIQVTPEEKSNIDLLANYFNQLRNFGRRLWGK